MTTESIAQELKRVLFSAPIGVEATSRKGQIIWTARGLVNDLIEALSTPPADDVREALIATLDDSANCWTYNGTHTVFSPSRGADVILAAFEVRPHGTVTDAEHREAVHRAVRAGIESVRSGVADRDVVRAVADQVLKLEARS